MNGKTRQRRSSMLSSMQKKHRRRRRGSAADGDDIISRSSTNDGLLTPNKKDEEDESDSDSALAFHCSQPTNTQRSLEKLIQTCAWDKVRQNLLSSYHHQQDFLDKQQKNIGFKHGRNLLSTAIAHLAPIDILDLVFEYHSLSNTSTPTSKSNSRSRNNHRHDTASIQLLLEQDSSFGYNALHIACSAIENNATSDSLDDGNSDCNDNNNNCHDHDKGRLEINLHPDPTNATSNDSNSSCHCDKIIQWILHKTNREGAGKILWQKDHLGFTPLHILCSFVSYSSLKDNIQNSNCHQYQYQYQYQHYTISIQTIQQMITMANHNNIHHRDHHHHHLGQDSSSHSKKRCYILEQTEQGQNALHLACSHCNASLELIQLLVQNYSDVSDDCHRHGLIQLIQNDGRNALHLAYMNNAPARVMLYLVQYHIQHNNNNNIRNQNILHQRDAQGYNHLHLACMNHVQPKVIQSFLRYGDGRRLVLEACQQGNNALLLACIHGTTLEIVKSFIAIGGDGGSKCRNKILMGQNKQHENALHLLCTNHHHHEPSNDNLHIIKYVAQKGGEILLRQRNVDGYNPLHLACIHAGSCVGAGSNTNNSIEQNTMNIIEALLDVGGKELALEKDLKNGYNALHILIRKAPSIHTIELLLNVGGEEILSDLDNYGNTPLHTACQYLKKTNVVDIMVQRSNLKIISFMNQDSKSPLDLLLKKECPSFKSMQQLQTKWFTLDPTASSVPSYTNVNILSWARHLSDDDLESALECGLIKAIMNKNFIKPINIALLMADLYIQIATVIVYSFLIHPTITGEAGSALPRNTLFVAVGWSAFRQVTEMFRIKSLYLFGPLKYVNLVQLVLIMWTALLFDGGGVSQTERIVYTLATGVSCLELLINFGNLSYPIAVFIIALMRIFWILLPFLFSTFLIVLSFAHMFYMWSISSLDTCRNFDVNGAKKVVDWKCNLSSSYAQTFSILITSNWSFLDDEAEGFQTTISYAFAFIVGILLLNILIAIINNSFSTIERSCEIEYWRCRLNFEEETQWLYSFTIHIVRPVWKTICDGLRILLQREKRYDKDAEDSAQGQNITKEGKCTSTNIRTSLFSGAPARGLTKTHGTGDYFFSSPPPQSRRCLTRAPSKRDYFFTQDLEERFVQRPNRTSFKNYSSAAYLALQDEERRNFFMWWFDGATSSSEVPNLKDRLWYFFRRASWDEIAFPGQAFENVVLGIKYNGEGKGLSFIFARLWSFVLIIVSSVIILVIFLSGLASFGLLWPNIIKEQLFFGPIESNRNNETTTNLELKVDTVHLNEEIEILKKSMTSIVAKQNELMDVVMMNQAQMSELISFMKRSSQIHNNYNKKR